VKHPLGKRLLSAADFVRQGAYFADIGTDHAYLPLFLIGEGKITRAVCTDINRGPLESAVKNARAFGYEDKIIFKLTDGADGTDGMGITDYAICGMGGELIADIIERSPHLMTEGVRLILQPMSRQSYLRRYLASRGFFEIGESYSCDSGKYYLCIAVEYDGACREISDFEAEFGFDDPQKDLTPEKQGYVDARLRALKKAADGKGREGEGSLEANLLLEYKERTKNNDG
jgi:tRNA (adenine22-N1)-methyltransferase